MNNVLPDKNLYKLFLSLVKIVPNILAVSKILGLILMYLKLPTFALTCFSGTSLIFIILLYLISFVFKFCGTHRLSLNYITNITLLSIVDYYIGIPISSENLYRLYGIISGAFMASWIVIWYKNRKNPKIDHMKQLCDTYSDCNC